MKHHYTRHHTHHTKHHKKMKKRGRMENYHQTHEAGTRKKRGLLIALIILVVLVVLVAVILILEKKVVEPNPIDVQCKFACENAQRTAFCFVERTVNNELTATCDGLSKNSLYAEYNVETCPAISCVVQEEADQTCVTGLGGKWESPDAEGKCPQTGITIVRQLTPSDKPLVQGQICCR
ncbi:hypothetical protein ES703_75206 [subsurface metagenome]